MVKPNQRRCNTLLEKFFSAIGVEQTPVSHAERIVSAIGGFTAILCIFMISQWAVDAEAAAILVASMGASAVLLFAVPHGQLSQPWSVTGGHLISALVGVSCAQWVANEVLAASLAVGLAIAAMYYLRCVHPPGGATALTAVIGGEVTHALGYQFVITPVLLNVGIILLVGFIFNNMFRWRRYPVYLHRLTEQQEEIPGAEIPSEISHADFVYALSQIDSFVDVSEYELLRIYELAINKSQESVYDADEITLGHYYSNGKYGNEWSVRQIVDQSPNTDPDKDMIIFKVVAGKGRRSSGYVTRMEFLQWAKHEVSRDEENWKRVTN